MAENFTNLGRDIDIQVHEANRSPQNFSPKQCSPRYIIIKLFKTKDKERILQATGKKKISPMREHP